jgi:hypothetical protein
MVVVVVVVGYLYILYVYIERDGGRQISTKELLVCKVD